MAGRPLRDVSVVYVQTAANVEPGHKGWVVANLQQLLGIFGHVDITDVALPRECWAPRLEAADVLVFGGGNTSYLMHQVRDSGLQAALPEYLQTKLYVGISAGSIIATPSTAPNSDDESKMKGLSLVDFGIQPHYMSPTFPAADSKSKVEQRKIANGIDYPLYALDDQSAVVVDNTQIRVVSEGSSQLLD